MIRHPAHTQDLDRPPQGTTLAAKLVVIAGPSEGLEMPLVGRLQVGTDPACDVVIRDPAVSRRHLEVRVEEGQIIVRDLGSRNGTLLSGARLVEAAVPLGTVLQMGGSALAIHPRWSVREIAPSTSMRFGEFVGSSIVMREVFAILERVAPTDITVLIEGESGTGKELAARSIHRASARADNPYVVFDCGAVPRELAESELFGHRRGAFSGAVAERAGAFLRADKGTLCLDEIGELPLDLQPKLLRVLETGEIRAVGDDAPRKIDVRIIAATNRDLQAEVRHGRFRSDLFYRLEVVRIRIPPLRLRPEDVPGLVATLLAGKLPEGDVVDGENLARLVAYSWPGNARELRNALARAVALARKPGDPPSSFARLSFSLGPASSTPATLGPDFPGVASPLAFKRAKTQLIESFERAYVDALLERHPKSMSEAAVAAGLSRKALYDLIARLNGANSGDS